MERTICKQIEPQLDAFHDGELPAVERQAVSEHLSGCAECVAKLARIDRVVHSLKTMPRLQVSESLAARLDSIATGRPATVTESVVALRPRVWAPIAAAAAVVALVVGLRVMPGNNAPALTASLPNTPNAQTMPRMLQPSSPIVAEKPQDAGPVQSDANAQTSGTAGSTGSSGASTRSSDASNGSSGASTGSVTVATASAGAGGSRSAGIPGSGPAGAAAARTSAASEACPSAIANNSGATCDGSASAFAEQELAEVPATNSSFNEALGISTDEDGLYDIKL